MRKRVPPRTEGDEIRALRTRVSSLETKVAELEKRLDEVLDRRDSRHEHGGAPARRTTS